MSIPSDHHSSRRKSLGLSLVELIVFIVIVGTAIAGIIGVISITTQSSADPLIRKQALAIAEAFLEEVQLQPFTVCDADDTGGATVAIGTIASASFGGSSGNNYVNVTGVNLSGQNAVVVFVGYNNVGLETVTSVVIDPGGANITIPYLADSNNTQSGNEDARIYLHGLVNPPQGTYTVRVNFTDPLGSSAGINVVVYPLSGVNTSAAFRTPGTAENDGSASSVTVPSAVGDLVLAGVSGETIDVSTVASPAVEDRDIGGGSCSGTDCSNNMATAHRNGAATSVNFSWTHDNDHWAAVGVSVKPGCAEAMGPEPGETRYSLSDPFDHVNDYHGFDSNTAVLPTTGQPGIGNIDGSLIPGLDGYRVTISVAAQPLGTGPSQIGNDASGNPQSLLITVTVTGPGNTTVTLNGYRTRYAPNASP